VSEHVERLILLENTKSSTVIFGERSDLLATHKESDERLTAGRTSKLRSIRKEFRCASITKLLEFMPVVM